MAEQFDYLYRKLFAEVDAIFEKYNIDPSKYLLATGEHILKANQEILASIGKNVRNMESVEDIATLNRQKLVDIFDADNTSYATNREFIVGSIIKTYLLDLCGYHFEINDGKVTYTHREDFELPSSPTKFRVDKQKNFEYINGKIKTSDTKPNEVELLLTEDGKMYYAPNDHLNLAYWLNLNGVDLHNAIRLESTKHVGDYSFTSLYNYKFSEDSDNDELIAINKAQASNLGAVYNALLSGWAYMRPLDEGLKRSTGFGVGKIEVGRYTTPTEEELIKHNITMFDRYMGGFDKNEYMKMIFGCGGSVHDVFSDGYDW